MIYDLLHQYIVENHRSREDNLDLNNLMFHRRFGLVVRLPHNWSYMDALIKTMKSSTASKILIIFPSTMMYHILYKAVDESTIDGEEYIAHGLTYISWHEIYTGMQMTSSDVRYMQRAKAILANAELTFFIDPPPLPELMDQIQGHTNGCLVVLSRGDGDV